MVASNPNKLLYGICIQANDFYETSDSSQLSSRKDRQFWRTPKVFCFVSQFPFTHLFHDIMVSIMSNV